MGYHAINPGIKNVDELERRPRGVPDHGEIPVLFLGQAAVDEGEQRRGLGGILMHHVLEMACVVADLAGCHAIILDVISSGGEAEFARRKMGYESFGFVTLASNPARVFPGIGDVRAVVRARSGESYARSPDWMRDLMRRTLNCLDLYNVEAGDAGFSGVLDRAARQGGVAGGIWAR